MENWWILKRDETKVNYENRMQRASLDGGEKRKGKVKIKQTTLLFYSVYPYNFFFNKTKVTIYGLLTTY